MDAPLSPANADAPSSDFYINSRRGFADSVGISFCDIIVVWELKSYFERVLKSLMLSIFNILRS